MTLDKIKEAIEIEAQYIHQPLFEERTNKRLLAIIEAVERVEKRQQEHEFGPSAEDE